MVPRPVGIVVLPGFQLLDLAGPLDVFAEANVQAGRDAYQPLIIGTASGPVASSAGARLLPDLVVGTRVRLDTVLVAGAPDLHRRTMDAGLIQWIRTTAETARRHGSVCTGAFVLAEAGLLAGRKATTHWSSADALVRRHPDVHLDVDAIHVRDGRLRTAAGVTASLDLALSLVEEDLGLDLARKVASQLVMFFRRGGGQLQYSRHGESRPAGRAALQNVQRWVSANPQLDHGVEAMAGHAGMSARHFARLFRFEVGTTPSAWVEALRIDEARRRLEAGAVPKKVASACGFADVDTFRRAFLRRLGVTPAEYRRRHASFPISGS